MTEKEVDLLCRKIYSEAVSAGYELASHDIIMKGAATPPKFTIKRRMWEASIHYLEMRQKFRKERKDESTKC